MVSLLLYANEEIQLNAIIVNFKLKKRKQLNCTANYFKYLNGLQKSDNSSTAHNNDCFHLVLSIPAVYNNDIIMENYNCTSLRHVRTVHRASKFDRIVSSW